MARAMSVERMAVERFDHRFGGGVSENNRALGFNPAFLDTMEGVVYCSRNPDGSPAACHRLDGLPETLIVERSDSGEVRAVKASLVAGFERDGRFFTREEAARLASRAPGERASS